MKKTSHRILIASLVSTGAAAAIAVSPIASAANVAGPNCTYSAPGNSVCASPGNAQIVAAPTVVPYQSWSGYGYGYGPPIFARGSHPIDHGGHR